MADLVKLWISVIIWGAVIVWLISSFITFVDFWFYDFVQSWLDSMASLFGSRAMNVFVVFFWLWGFVLVVRFIMSWWSEDVWHSANH